MSDGWIGDLSWELVGRDTHGEAISFLVCPKSANLLVKTVIEENACSGKTRLFGSFSNRILKVIKSELIERGAFLRLTGLSDDGLSALEDGKPIEVDSLVAANCAVVIDRIQGA
ncbi:hypothetical protein EII22_02305 [Coriobacteriales bacterium OH1046]|nr:hypothetical protein EII22_02305 [Coriobacteriales bacterium OH1046]